MNTRFRLVAGSLSLSLTALASPALSSAADADAGLTTLAEQSHFQRTGRYEEVGRLCAAFQHRFSDAVRCSQFGRTPEGRPMWVLAISRSGALTPEQARQRNLPVMLMQGGIHAGEIDGKDAGFRAVRELLSDSAAAGALKSFVLVFVPVFNVDGHERVSRGNRPNQVGPEEMGWRATAQNFNLNRDYAKADTPEMQAMLKLLGAWDPVLYVDMHVTDGAEFQHDVSNTLEPIYAGDPQLQPAGAALLKELNTRIAAMGSQPLDFYPDFVSEDDPASGFAVAPQLPRFSDGYWDLHNRFALLVETHSWKDYPTRVRVTRNIIVSLAEMMAREGAGWRAQARQADTRATHLGGQDVTLEYTNGPHVTMIDFQGYAYTRELSPVSGTLVTRYDTSKPEIWHVPLKDTTVPKTTVKAPAGGYIVPAAYAGWVAEKLTLHGIRFERLDQARSDASLETFRATSVTYSKVPFEGHTTLKFEGKWQAERRAVPAGSLFVPNPQPGSRVLVALLEPQAPDSLAAWGFFNTAFEAEEYMEPYVAEPMARDMLARDPKLAAAFKERIATDPQFAADPQARLDFFYRRSPYWDERLNLYPVYRVAAAP
ncbi:MAG TPA: M14 family zinc carboxypeptidase [Steroidobacteraceae bacterium]|nr:M14 family zinc carboxypeptidase [Steroidobacteraceae bacterium]